MVTLNMNIVVDVDMIDWNTSCILMQQQRLNSNVMHVMMHYVMRLYETYRSKNIIKIFLCLINYMNVNNTISLSPNKRM
jgi:hypothetical protein